MRSRAAGWYVCFPADQRPSYWRVFRVRLAADGVGYFTIRGVASEPLRVVLLMGHISPVVSAAATVLERTAMGIMSVVGVGIFAGLAVQSDMLPPGWQDVFRGISIIAAVVLILTMLFLMRLLMIHDRLPVRPQVIDASRSGRLSCNRRA